MFNPRLGHGNLSGMWRGSQLPLHMQLLWKRLLHPVRIPESHGCTGMPLVKRPFESERSRSESIFRLRPQPTIGGVIGWSEAQQILVAWLVLSISFSAGAMMSLQGFIERFILLLFTVGLGVVLHELAHRYFARRYGCWSGFRIWPAGLGLALQ